MGTRFRGVFCCVQDLQFQKLLNLINGAQKQKRHVS